MRLNQYTKTQQKDYDGSYGVLFLDIDGVICTNRAYVGSGQDQLKSILRTWDPISIQLVDRIAMDYNLSVVISSTWRQHYDVPLILLTHGFKASFHKNDITPNDARTRGCQIYDWLSANRDVKNFVIFDDDTTGIEQTNLHPFQTVTSDTDGVLYSHYKKAQRILDAQLTGSLVYDHDDRWLDDSDKRDWYINKVW